MAIYHFGRKFNFDDDTIIVLPTMSKRINSILEDMMKANVISRQPPQMLKNPFIDNKNMISVQKKSLGLAPRKQSQKVESKPPNAPLRK
jgi:hypothetical protein